MNKIVLTIAGTDPSGGAGIQSDLRTFAALGVVGVSVITALTVQNSQGVQSVHPVDADLVAAQLNALLEDAQVDAVKIGMLGGAAQMRVVADALRRFRPPNVVLDPVLASTGGVPLLDDAGRRALLEELLPLCDLVTPNLSEAEALGTLHAPAVLIKGGHLSGDPVDRLTFADGSVVEFPGRRIDTPHTHGTGCLLSSTIAALLARGTELPEAVGQAKSMLTAALREPVMVGQGRGYPELKIGVQYLRNSVRPKNQQLALLRTGLYFVTDPDLRSDRSLEEQVQAALAGGAKIVQLRDKHLSTPKLIALAKRLNQLARAANALFIINDRVDVALASEADGMHLGPDDMRPEDARRLLGREKLIGVSGSTVEEAEQAAPYASYLGVGAIFGSQTKNDAGEPVGVERIREIKSAFPHLPLVAIGGINADNIAEVAAAGADAAAVVSAVVCALDMEAATRELVQKFTAGRERTP